MERAIVHMDLDTFFVSCERLTNSQLNGIPLIIGGGDRILYKLRNVRGDVFKHRPQLKAWDWPLILLKALLT